MKEIDGKLRSLAEGNEEYAKFHERIAKTRKRILGVRMPDMRRLAKSIAKGACAAGAADGGSDAAGPVGGGSNVPGPDPAGKKRRPAGMSAKEVRGFIASSDKDVYEHVLLAGLLINYVNLTDKERISLTREYLKYADSWALIDLFAEKMKGFDRDMWRNFLVRCLASSAEFTVRYGVIVFLSNYLEDASIDGVFADLRGIKHEGYYVKMGLAWLYAEAAVTHYDKTLRELASGVVEPWTRRKAYQKMLESFRFTAEQKEEIRALRAGLDRRA